MELAREVLDAIRAALAQWTRPARERRELELAALKRSAALPVFRLVQQRLRYFSFVAPRREKGLLAALLLGPGQYDETQRLRFGNESIEVTVTTGVAWECRNAEPRTMRLVVLRLWNPEHLHEVTRELVERAAKLEPHLDELGLAQVPRKTDLLGLDTPERFPELLVDR